MKMSLKFALALFALGLLAARPPAVQSSKILAVFAFPGKSHYMMHSALISELIQNGHEITMITALTLAPLKLGNNYTEILIEPVYDFWADIKQSFGANNLFELTRMDVFDFLKMLEILGIQTTEHALKQPKVREIINATETAGVYDLLLVEQFYQEAFLALAYKYNIPVVSASTLGYENHMSQMMGLITPWSFVPHGFLAFSDRMSFIERLHNSFFSLYEDLLREYIYFPKMDKLVEQHFGHLNIRIPPVTVMEKHLSLMLLNSHIPLTSARPTVESMVAVGGMHIYPPKPLPADIQKFLDEAVHGVIYFSLGSNLQSKDMPSENMRIFLNVFRKLKQRVLWKFENENIPDLPANVMIKKWLPQNDILAHRNTKVFITHGGLFGTQEGVYHGVPMLGMPFYCDQHLNMKKAVQSGYAISLHFQSITEQVLHNALRELLENPNYQQNVQQISQIFRDRPMNARQTAVYWIEYVLRHRGAPHLRSAGLDLKWYQFYLLDVIAVMACGMLLLLATVFAVLKCIWRRRQATGKQKLQ